MMDQNGGRHLRSLTGSECAVEAEQWLGSAVFHFVLLMRRLIRKRVRRFFISAGIKHSKGPDFSPAKINSSCAVMRAARTTIRITADCSAGVLTCFKYAFFGFSGYWATRRPPASHTSYRRRRQCSKMRGARPFPNPDRFAGSRFGMKHSFGFIGYWATR